MQPTSTTKNLLRVLQALARAGLDVTHEPGGYRVRLHEPPGAPAGEVLLPDAFPLEGKALRQLADLAIDMNAPVEQVWWWGSAQAGKSEHAARELERWFPVLQALGWSPSNKKAASAG
ncbi:MAG TPA: hypothetical protein PKW35_24510 [Nannocystaceae bacterium]|nr:hypothetical protein [Nannocystaceae bacterium]